jgi:branched-chain amino acid transport system permease protein
MVTVPLYVPEGYVRVIIMANYLAIFAISWDILSGHTGYVSFGHTLLIAISGYVSAILSYPPGSWPRSDFHLGLPLYFTIPAGIAVATLTGFVFFIPGLKTKGPYFVLVTLAASIVGEGIATLSGDIGGATRGLFGFPTTVSGCAPNYYLSLILLCIIGFTLWSISKSDMGQLLRAISIDEDALSFLGKNVLKLKAVAFFVSALVAGIGGAFYFHYLGSISPHSAFSYLLLIEILLSAVIGGMGTIIGPIIGAYFTTLILEGLRPVFPEASASARVIAYLIIGLAVYLKRPQGLYLSIKRLLKIS